MACEIEVPIVLDSAFLQQIRAAGIGMTIQVDCSHNAHVVTFPTNAPGNQTIAKAIELDTALSIAAGATIGSIFSALQGASSRSKLFALYGALQGINGGVNALSQRNVKVGFPQFTADLVDLTTITLQLPVAACTAPTAAAFNLLPLNTRKSMGMYLRNVDAHGQATYQRQGPDDNVGRSA